MSGGGGGTHGRVAHGRDAEGYGGGSRGDVLAAAAEAATAAGPENAARMDGGGGPPAGGRIVEGAALSPFLRSAVHDARRRPPGFASFCNREAEPRDAVAVEAFPADLRDPQPGAEGRPPRRRRRGGRGLSRGADERAEQASAGGIEGRGHADIDMASLFLPGVYKERVLEGMREADAATAALRARTAGEDVKIPHVPTVVISQEEMAPWARGTVWDCADPARCRPVQRSTRATAFPDERQLDRAE
eukprot:6089449-Pleurochrysis_carterae.AAC.4